MQWRNPYNWGACPTGEWQRLSAGLLLRKRLAALRNACIGLIATLGLVGGTWAMAAQLRDKTADESAPCHGDPTPVPLKQDGVLPVNSNN